MLSQLCPFPVIAIKLLLLWQGPQSINQWSIKYRSNVTLLLTLTLCKCSVPLGMVAISGRTFFGCRPTHSETESGPDIFLQSAPQGLPFFVICGCFSKSRIVPWQDSSFRGQARVLPIIQRKRKINKIQKQTKKK